MSKRITQLEVGETYLFEQGLSLYLGRVVSIDGPHTVVIDEASWVAETGRRNEFMRRGKAEGMEIELLHYPKGIHWSGWTWWPHPLPKESV